MAMHNFGPNPVSQAQDQLKNQSNESPWHVSSKSTVNNNNNLIDSQATSKSTTSPSNSAFNNRQQSNLQSQQNQQYGLLNPQLPASIHSSLASRVDQIIRNTLNDSPAYTPPTSNNSHNLNSMTLSSSTASMMTNPTGNLSHFSAPHNVWANTNAPRPPTSYQIPLVPGYQNPMQHSSSVASNSRPNPIFSNPMLRDQKQSLAAPPNFPPMKVSSPYQQPPFVGTQPLSRPPRSHSTIGGLGLGSFDGPPGINVPGHVRQPPAAHQSSSRPIVPVATDMTQAPAHSFNAPVAAHMSSKTPLTPKIQDNPYRAKVSPYTNATYPNKPTNQQSTLKSSDQFGSPIKLSDADSANSLPIQSLLRQQEMANRELILRRSITPQFTTHSMSGQGHPVILGPRGLELSRLDGGPRSPSQVQIAHLGNQDPYRLPNGPNNMGMQPPHSRPFENNKLPYLSGSQSMIPSNEAQLKQYSAIMSAHQQQQLNLLHSRSPESSSLGSIPAHGMGGQVHPVMFGPRGIELSRLEGGPRSPSQVQIAHLGNQDHYRQLNRSNSMIMQPPHSRSFESSKLPYPPAPQTSIPNNDAQLKQYSAIMSAHQQQQLNLLHSRSPDNPNLGPIQTHDMSGQGHPVMLGPRGIELSRLDGGPRSPSQVQIAHLGNQDPYRLPNGPNGMNMPPPHSRPFENNKLPYLSGSQSMIPSNEAQLKQYSAIMSAHQQQQQLHLLHSKSPDKPNPSSIPTSQHHSSAQVFYPGIAVTSTASDHAQFDMQQSNSISPKQQNQRSIITGSASNNSKESKKSKLSPIGNNPSKENKAVPSTLDETADNKFLHTAYDVAVLDQQEPHISRQQDLNDTNDQLSKLAAAAAAATALAVQTSMDGGEQRTACLSRNDDGAPTTQACGISVNAHLNEKAPLKSQRDESNIDRKLGIDNSDNSHLSEHAATKNDYPSISGAGSLNTSVANNLEPGTSDTSQETSKYQKLFTKKAWLKTYDLEDQAKTNEDIPSDMAVKPITKTEREPIENSKVAETKESQKTSKTNGNSKNNKASKIEPKKKTKVSRNKSSSLTSLKDNKNVDHDSEETTASTSDLDDTTDEADSTKSAGDKKLRRMPRRKVKVNPDREQNQSSGQTKTRSLKDAARKRVKREKVAINTSDNDSTSTSNIKRKYNSDDESVKQKTKKVKDNGRTWNQDDEAIAKNKKRAGEKFLQTCPCYDIVPKNIRCMECRRVRQSSLKNDKFVPSKLTSRTNWDDFCRFYEFRKLRYNKSEQIVVAGFSDMSDAKESDMKLWLPNETDIPGNINYNIAKFILTNVGTDFCNLVLQERSVQEEYKSKNGDKKITWKRAVNGLRELCDVCSTTLFNCHFVCERCGFVVCIDCHQYRARQQLKEKERDENVDLKKEGSPSATNESNDEQAISAPAKKSKKDCSGWIYCAKNEEHSAEKMILARIVAGDCLEEVWNLLHETKKKLNLGPCVCGRSGFENTSDILDTIKNMSGNHAGSDSEDSHSTLKGLMVRLGSPTDRGLETAAKAIAFNDQKKSVTNDSIDNDAKVFDFGNDDDSQDDSKQVSAAIEECIASLSAKSSDEIDDVGLKPLDTSVTSKESTWSTLCNGDLLVLNQPKHKENLLKFREHWRFGKPVLVRGVDKLMNMKLWLPQFFAVQFGDYRSDLVDCRNGDIHRQSMKKYWEGFEPSVHTKKKNKDDSMPTHVPPAPNEEPSAITTAYYCGSALWRLKDWPPGQDFNEILPEHYNDFMNNLPLRSYTTRTGKLNLACRLPKEMLKPDLGPKMYSAYGTTKFPERGTTNLHLDISDAINVMVYVGGAASLKNGSNEVSEMFDKTIDEANVDPEMKSKIRRDNLTPGALWHIFKPSDALKMREFLNKVADERKISPEKRTDPIHDQIWYLDQNLLDRLHKEYGVVSYPILQCMGDAILIPAGAPHQVKNLQNCIKVANDFVSPENVHWCLKLTDEFRKLPETHINQEDKLQIKNILYHSVKVALQYIKMAASDKDIREGSASDSDAGDETDAEKTESEYDSNENENDTFELKKRETATSSPPTDLTS